MQEMVDEYKDLVEFRLIYIREAHAADGDWPVGYAEKFNITNHKDYGERCAVATRLLDEKSLDIPTVIDGMDNKVNEAYSAQPDRIFLVRSDGRLGVAGAPGPMGFGPALEQVADWLAELRSSGAEPSLAVRQPKGDHPDAD
jgi:hypothetical protein